MFLKIKLKLKLLKKIKIYFIKKSLRARNQKIRDIQIKVYPQYEKQKINICLEKVGKNLDLIKIILNNNMNLII